MVEIREKIVRTEIFQIRLSTTPTPTPTTPTTTATTTTLFSAQQVDYKGFVGVISLDELDTLILFHCILSVKTSLSLLLLLLLFIEDFFQSFIVLSQGSKVLLYCCKLYFDMFGCFMHFELFLKELG